MWMMTRLSEKRRQIWSIQWDRRPAMLLPLEGRRLYYDLSGPEDGPVVCMTHSLMSDSGMWSEQMPTLLQAGLRVLRLDMRGHGGSDPGAGGDYTMQGIADDWAAALEALGLPRVHYIGLSIGGQSGQAFAIYHGRSEEHTSELQSREKLVCRL